MKARIVLALTMALLAAAALPGPAAAFPIAPVGTEGLGVVASGTDHVVATYEGNSATYSNDLFLMLDAFGNVGDDGDLTNDLFIFNNHSSAVGSTIDLDAFTPGTELLFRLFVHNTGYNYYTGAGTRNPDGKAHARVQDNWNPGVTLVSFEDLFNTPEYPAGYNDLSFSFTNTTTTVASVPEPGLGSLLLGGMLGLIGLGRRKLLGSR
ncbi:MAG TPA: PEP-CTERM sorting domain-containing protein [Candidatus Eisenbacteria bacterium]